MKVNKLSPVQQLDVFVRARYPVIWIVSQEETRVESSVLGLLQGSPKHRHKEALTWTISKGVRIADEPSQEFGPQDPIAALQVAGEYGVTGEAPKGTPAVFVFKDVSEIGGLDLLRQYLTRRKPAFTEEARAYGIQTPKGLLLVGMSGRPAAPGIVAGQ
jgi:hypothetical protein